MTFEIVGEPKHTLVPRLGEPAPPGESEIEEIVRLHGGNDDIIDCDNDRVTCGMCRGFAGIMTVVGWIECPRCFGTPFRPLNTDWASKTAMRQISAPPWQFQDVLAFYTRRMQESVATAEAAPTPTVEPDPLASPRRKVTYTRCINDMPNSSSPTDQAVFIPGDVVLYAGLRHTVEGDYFVEEQACFYYDLVRKEQIHTYYTSAPAEDLTFVSHGPPVESIPLWAMRRDGPVSAPDPNWLISITDAFNWIKEFCKVTNFDDETWALQWFMNASKHGFARATRYAKKQRGLTGTSEIIPEATQEAERAIPLSEAALVSAAALKAECDLRIGDPVSETPRDPNWLLFTTDAQDWAKEFCKTTGFADEAWAIAWFANAIMCGFDDANRKARVQTNPVPDPDAPSTPYDCFAAANRSQSERRFADAIPLYERGLAQTPDEPEALRELALCLAEMFDYARAETVLRRSLAIESNHGGAWCQLGAFLGYQGKHAEAGRALERAVHFAPHMPAAQWNRALWCLMDGQWRHGWHLYQWGVAHRQRFPRTLQPEWDGSVTPGGTLFLWCEQGYGDTIQMLRFVHEAKAQGQFARVVLEVQADLVTLCEGMADFVFARTRDMSIPVVFDEHCSLMNLPRVLRVDSPNGLKTDFDGHESYLTAEPFAMPTGTHVGVCWHGSAAFGNDNARSVTRETLKPILDVPDVHFVCLQKGEADAPPLVDFAETARWIASLDLVITVDTCIAHLAGALGKPVWILLSYANDWRWLRDRTDTPWYASARLYRQETLGDWAGLVRQVAGDLHGLVQDKAADLVTEGNAHV